MLEVFDVMKRCDDEGKVCAVVKVLKEKPELENLLWQYANNQDYIITPNKIFGMMKYYGVENGRKVNDVCEVGYYTNSRVKLLRQKFFGWNKDQELEIFVDDPVFLMYCYKKLHTEVRSTNQYELLKTCLLLLKPTDVKWFARMLCNKVGEKENVKKGIEQWRLQKVEVEE